MLPVSMVTGICLYLAFHLIPCLKGAEEGFMAFATKVQPAFVSVMLFLQLNVVAPSDLKPRKWFLALIAFQCILFVGLSLTAAALPDGEPRLLVECAMLCIIAPTAAAAGVITGKIGGSISNIMAYTVIINFVAALLIPLMIPLVNPGAEVTFLGSFLNILRRVFSILVLPLLLAWLIRYCLPKLHLWLERYVGLAFYIWAFSLCFALAIATGAVVESRISVLTLILIGLISLGCCLLQFAAGRHAWRFGSHEDPRHVRRRIRSDSITGGQALGQKNTGFIIWLGFAFLTPVTSVAGGMYAIWQNLVNSWELFQTRHEAGGHLQ